MREFITIVESAEELGYTVSAYHGTQEPFEAFKIGVRNGGSSGSREGPLGIWFTDNEAAAREFARWSARSFKDGHLMPVKLRMQNPWVITDYNDIRDLVDRHTKFDRPDYHVGGRQIRMVQDKIDYAGARQELRDNGYDSIWLKQTMLDSVDGHPIDQYVLLDPRNVRLRDAAFQDPDSEDLLA